MRFARLSFLLAALSIVAGTRAHAFDLDEARVRYTVSSWNEKDGLPSSYVRGIAQDRAGYLWLATYAGLVRFDGVRFETWTPPDGTSLPSDDLASILVAHDGSLWVGTFGGVAHLVDGRIVGPSPPKGLFDGYVSELVEDKGGIIWVAGQDGVARFDGTRWEKIGAKYQLPERPASSLFQDDAGTIWVGTSAGLYEKPADSAAFKPYEAVSDAVESVAQDTAGHIIVTHPTRLISLLGHTDAQTGDLPLQRSHGTRLMLDREGSLWAGTRSQGLFRIRRDRNHNQIIDRVTRADGLSADSVLALLQDREGNIWVGTPFGLNRLSENAIIPVPADQGLSGFVRAVASSDGGNIWAATEDSLVYFSAGQPQRYDWNNILPNRTLIALHEDRHSGTLWISTNQGLMRLVRGQFSAFKMPDDLRLTRIRSMTVDGEGRLWLCDADRGVLRSTDSSLQSFESIIANKPATWVYAAKDGRVWMGLANGSVGAYENGALKLYSEGDGLPGGAVTAIHDDHEGTVWVGTHNGLSRFERDRFVSLSRNAGFPGTGPVAIADDGQDLWLGVTGLGILRVNRKEFDNAVGDPLHRLRYRQYGVAQGLRATPARQFGTPSSARAADGSIWFLTGNGLAVVDPTRLADTHVAAPLLIEDMVADGRFEDVHDNLTLAPNTSTLRFDYTLLRLSPMSQVNFRYRLEGFDKGWIDAGTRRQAFYTNVPPGQYRFVVNATGEDSSSGSEASWRFAIQPRFYQTRLFAFASTLMLILGFWGLWQLRLHQIRRRFSVVLTERARMGREIHDTLLQGLVGVAMQFKVIAEHVHSSPDQAKERLERLRKLVENYIYETRQSIWDLRSPTLESDNLVAAVRSTCEILTEDKSIQFELSAKGKPYTCSPKIQEQLLRVAREAVSNAVRHGEPTVVRVEIHYTQTNLRLKVTDDGHGFNVDEASDAGPHCGLISMRERAAQVNGRLEIASDIGRGTQVELTLPSPGSLATS